MKRSLFFILLPFLCFTGLLSAAYPELSQQERNQFNQKLDQELLNAQKRVTQAIQDFASQQSAFDPGGKIRIDALTGTLETKTILVNNYRFAPSIKSPAVRQKLLSILNQDIVDMDDVLTLQQLVDQERSNL